MSVRLKSVVNHAPKLLGYGMPLHVAKKVLKAVGCHILLHPVLVCKPLQEVSTGHTRVKNHFDYLIHRLIVYYGGPLIDETPDLRLFIGAADDLYKIMRDYVLDPGLEEEVHLLS
jgi:hypothetical protein